MKTKLFFSIVCFIFSFNVTAQNTHVPDDNFEQALIDRGYDTGPLDDYVPTVNINTLKSLGVSGRNISDLKGIEDFISLTLLECYNNNLTNLDVSNNTSLTRLDCYDNDLTNLDVSKNTALKVLLCGFNQLTNLDVSLNVALEDLYCPQNELTSLNVSNNIELTTLWCQDNQLTSLDVTNNKALTELLCQKNQITSLDVSNNIALIDLWCRANNLISIDVSKNTALNVLRCHNNQLTSLDVTKNTALIELRCDSNQLTSLDVSKNIELITLLCFGNQLTSLDVTKNTKLKVLSCSNNPLTSLDVSLNTSLEHFQCNDSLLACLILKNGNNDNIVDELFKIQNNPNLLCVEVDDADYSSSNWVTFVDDQIEFSEDNCPGCSICSECVILEIDEVHLDDNNDVIGNICTIEDMEIPLFYYNTVCNDGSPDVVVDKNQTVILDGFNYGKLEIKEGATVTFTQKNIFICELKIEKYTTMHFEDCASLFVDKKVVFNEFTNFNPEMNNVSMFVDDNVEVKKGSNISAYIHANDNDIKVEGESNKPVYMKGQFVAKKIEGKKYVTWEVNAYCDPCIDIPETTASCECKGGLTEVTFEYVGGTGASIASNSGTVTDNGDGTYTISDNGEKLEKNLEITVGSSTAEVHTSCSQDILGVTFAGGITVIGYVDTERNISTLEACQPGVGTDCECKGGLIEVTFSFSGNFNELSTNSGTIAENIDGTFTVSDNGEKLEKNLEVYSGGNTAEIHTSCSQDIIGVTFSGGVTVEAYIDTEGNITTVDGCSQTEVEGPDCECKGGLTEVTIEYSGGAGAFISSNSGTVNDNGDGTYTISNNGVKLDKNLEIYAGGNTAEFHTSCSQEILGVTFSGVTVIGYIDTEGSVTSIETCPVAPEECECKGGLTEVTFSFGGNFNELSTNSGTIAVNNDGTFTVSDNGEKLEKNLEITTNSGVAEIHTSCSQDILGVTFSGGVTVVKHVDTEGNVCSIIDNTAGRQGNALAKGSDVESKDEFNKENPKVDFNVKSWPNPSSNNFNIKVTTNNDLDKVNIQVMDITGKRLQEGVFDWDQSYKFGESLQSGIYFVKIAQASNTKTVRVIKN